MSFANLLDGLAAVPGIEPHVITFLPGLERPDRVAVDGVPVVYLPGTQRFGNVTLHVRERRLLAATLDELRPDVVHAQDALRYGYVCLRAARRAPVVVSIHGIVREELRYATGLVTPLRIRVAGVSMERYCVRHARFLVAPTRYAEQVFGDEIRGRLWDIGNPIADRLFRIDSEPELGRILYAGGVTRGKRLLDLVDAMPRILELAADTHVRVAGDLFDAAYAREVRSRVQQLSLEGRVRFLGGLSFDELLEEYGRASVLVLPSGKETSPMVIGEAMAAGVPVVATRVGGIPYLVDEGTTGHIVEVGDVATLGERVAGIVSDPVRRASFGAAARAKAFGSFRIAVVAARMSAVYEELLATASLR